MPSNTFCVFPTDGEAGGRGCSPGARGMLRAPCPGCPRFPRDWGRWICASRSPLAAGWGPWCLKAACLRTPGVAFPQVGSLQARSQHLAKLRGAFSALVMARAVVPVKKVFIGCAEGPLESPCCFRGTLSALFFPFSTWKWCRAAQQAHDGASLPPSPLLRDVGSLVTPVRKSVFLG